MLQKDRSGASLTGASALAAQNYETALDAYYCYAGDPITPLEEALADSPQFVMGHALMAYLTLIGTNVETMQRGLTAYQAALPPSANDRERGHVQAIGALIGGEIKTAGRILEDLSIDNPRDTLALQVGQLCDFLVGDSRMLRDRIGRALPPGAGLPRRARHARIRPGRDRPLRPGGRRRTRSARTAATQRLGAARRGPRDGDARPPPRRDRSLPQRPARLD